MPDFAKALRQIRPAEDFQRNLFQTGNPATSITQQLGYLRAKTGRQTLEPVREMDLLPAGTEEVTPFGRHYVVHTVYDQDYFHGKVRMSRFSCSDLRHLTAVMRERASVPDRSEILFLDTETTGMQGGAGMCPFLVGLGYFVDDDFHMLQYFIRDFDEEPSMLYALGKLAERFRLVVTYNGASFDIPLLETRFTLARFDSPFANMPHLDLLTTARRLWRNGHGSCRLVALEKEIVSFLRGPDVPGAMIPRVYFDYLQQRHNPALHGVFTHNVYDVVSLAALTVCAADRVVSEPAAFDDPQDLYSLARVLENTSEWKRAIHFYEMALAGDLPDEIRQRAEEGLAVIFRRCGEHERALATCQRLVSASSFSIVGYEGAAVYYERVAGDPAVALTIVEEGLSRLQDIPETKRWRLSLTARRERLRQKAIQF